MADALVARKLQTTYQIQTRLVLLTQPSGSGKAETAPIPKEPHLTIAGFLEVGQT